jgi:heme-degrading monooxygenase HmoA
MWQQALAGYQRLLWRGRSDSLKFEAPGWSYLIIWAFQAKPGREEEFERVYGPAGDWARFFAQGEGYLGTELSRDTKIPGRYLTLDFWASAQCYENFRQKHAAEYHDLDKRCEELTQSEQQIGCFQPTTPKP